MDASPNLVRLLHHVLFTTVMGMSHLFRVVGLEGGCWISLSLSLFFFKFYLFVPANQVHWCIGVMVTGWPL